MSCLMQKLSKWRSFWTQTYRTWGQSPTTAWGNPYFPQQEKNGISSLDWKLPSLYKLQLQGKLYHKFTLKWFMENISIIFNTIQLTRVVLIFYVKLSKPYYYLIFHSQHPENTSRGLSFLQHRSSVAYDLCQSFSLYVIELAPWRITT